MYRGFWIVQVGAGRYQVATGVELETAEALKRVLFTSEKAAKMAIDTWTDEISARTRG